MRSICVPICVPLLLERVPERVLVTLVIRPDIIGNFRDFPSVNERRFRLHITSYRVFTLTAMGKLSEYARKRIISLRSSGTKQTKIKELLEQEGIKTSRSAISLFLSRYSKTGDIGDAPRCGRTAKLAPETIAYIEEKMQENEELTSRELKDKLSNECDVQISEATIRRVRRKLGWKVEKADIANLCVRKIKSKG